MRLSIAAMSMAFGILWGACILVVAVANMIWPSYGRAFLELSASIYPGYRPGTGVGSVFIGTIYAVVEAALAEQSLAGSTTFSLRARCNKRP
jgi:hypothetical protein